MLNLGFSPALEQRYGRAYRLPEPMAEGLVGANADFSESSPELRTQNVWGDEIWSRIRSLGLEDLDWDSSRVLDACAGRGFLSYHLLRHVRPRSLTLVDVAQGELAAAEELLAGAEVGQLTFVCADLVELEGDGFDVVVGNSFVHHFPDVRRALATIRLLLKPGGWFIGLHEPTPVAVPLESGRIRHVAACSLSKARYLQHLRYRGPEDVLAGTTDIWMFEVTDMEELLRDAGFEQVLVIPRYLFRPFIVALLGIHLNSENPKLSAMLGRILAVSVQVDLMLARILPKRMFGGLAFAAKAPNA